MAKLATILEEKLNRLETIPEQFATQVEKTQIKVFKAILRDLNKLQLDVEGEVLLNNYNLALIETIGEKYKAELYAQGYTDAVTFFAKEMDLQNALNVEYLQGALGKFDYKNIYQSVYETSKKTAIELLADSAVSTSVDDFKTLLTDSITNSDTFADMVDSISASIQGNDKIEGNLLRYARQNALDLFAGTERNMTKVISDDLGIEFFEYAGGLMDTTRPFCQERAGKVYHKKEIEEWGTKTWAGQAKGTTSRTIFTLAGGYNCNHDFIPKGLKDVPTSVIKRNIENGNINPDDLPQNIKKRIGI
jgi:hypothetical protein